MLKYYLVGNDRDEIEPEPQLNIFPSYSLQTVRYSVVDFNRGEKGEHKINEEDAVHEVLHRNPKGAFYNSDKSQLKGREGSHIEHTEHHYISEDEIGVASLIHNVPRLFISFSELFIFFLLRKFYFVSFVTSEVKLIIFFRLLLVGVEQKLILIAVILFYFVHEKLDGFGGASSLGDS